jgi:carbon-monoxide dehydrogenase large subunit
MPCTPERVWRAIHTEAGKGVPWSEPPAVFADLPERDAGGAVEGGDIDI